MPNTKTDRSQLLAWLFAPCASTAAKDDFDDCPLLPPEEITSIEDAIAECKDLLAAIEQSRKMSKVDRLSYLLLHKVLPTGTPFKRHCGFVYLMRLEDGIFKIGKADNPESRLSELRSEYRCKIRLTEKYPTVVDYAFERALHNHFRRFRIEREGRRELFDLPRDSTSDFSVLAAELEPFVLTETAARLELELRRLELEAGRC